MSSLYIHDKNVRMVWDAIQKSPLFHESKVDTNWLISIMQRLNVGFPVILSSEKLLECNRQTINYMMQDINMRVKQSRQSRQSHHQQFNSNNININTNFNDSLHSRLNVPTQDPRDDGLLRHSPQEIDFSIKENDRDMPSIEELVELHKRERDALYGDQPVLKKTKAQKSNSLVIEELCESDVHIFNINDAPIQLMNVSPNPTPDDRLYRIECKLNTIMELLQKNTMEATKVTTID